MITDFAARLHAVLARIRAAEQRFQRPPGSVRLLAASKTQSPAAIA
ncbi:MAG: YggS family pyridoxal phosphate enzyme, partial [Candidatus Contendobacter sp.]|nr:YggS family pyridoxal phosphate enzyme [Candidatus Contendobacter sp.]